MRILFCCETFASARALLQERLPSEAGDEICVWPDRGTATDLTMWMYDPDDVPNRWRNHGRRPFPSDPTMGDRGLKTSIWKPRQRTHIRQPCGIRS